MPAIPLRRGYRILILNPNSDEDMTRRMGLSVRDMQLDASTEIFTYTAPEGSPKSINNADDLTRSTEAVGEIIAAHQDLDIWSYDAILVACYSLHPLVPLLSPMSTGDVLVLGIFEASILTCLSLVLPYPGVVDIGVWQPSQWGIVTTGKFWEEHLSAGVVHFLGQSGSEKSSKFAGVFTTGLDASDFHGGVSPEVVREKLTTATRELLADRQIGCVVMGCAGMAGLEDLIRSVLVETYGKARAEHVYVIDGVKAGVGLLEQTIKNRRMFRP